MNRRWSWSTSGARSASWPRGSAGDSKFARAEHRATVRPRARPAARQTARCSAASGRSRARQRGGRPLRPKSGSWRLVPIVVGRALPPIMTHKTPITRPAMTAIAAVMALSAPSFAQSAVEPVVEIPVPAVEVAPAPVAVEPLAAEPVVIDSAVDPVAAEPAAKPARKATTAKAATPRPAAARAASTAPAVASTAPVAEAPAATPLPIESVAAAPLAAPAAPADATDIDLLRTAALGGLGLVALAGAGLAIRSRRRRAEDAEDAAFAGAEADAAADPAMTVEPGLEAPAPLDPLFAEDPTAPRPANSAPVDPIFAAVSASAGSPSACDDAAPGSHVEAACEGPTENNPSLSIKKRLKRAHVFDQREFLAEAGAVAPMAADAGLPDAAEAPAPAPNTREPA